MIPFWVKKTEENRDICRWKKESFTSKVEITRNLLNKDIKKENFKKNLMDLIEKIIKLAWPLINLFQAITCLKDFWKLRVSTCF